MKKIANKKSVWLIAMMLTAIADAAAVLAEPADFRMRSFYRCSTCAVSKGKIFWLSLLVYHLGSRLGWTAMWTLSWGIWATGFY